jgi:homoserine/homoserine lactone efflux protein
MSVEFFCLYLGTAFLASIIPGPSMLLALSHGIRYGAKPTMVTALGNVAASLLQASAAIAGLGTILHLSETVFLWVKLFGAAYLIYIGICTWRSAGSKPEVAHAVAQNRPPLRSMFFQAFWVAASNPKAVIFFTALFPQFINPHLDRGLQYMLLLGGLAPVAFVCFMLYALGGEKIIGLFAGRDLFRKINKLVGGVFVGAGIALALSRR